MIDTPPLPDLKRVALVGLGLSGSSIARAMKARGFKGHLAGADRDGSVCKTVLDLNLVDSMDEDPSAAAAGADLVILCTPVGAFGELAAEICGVLAPGAILSDVGSVKGAVVRDVGPHVPEGVHLIPGHPVSGTEQSGPEAGFAELFESRWVILTPPSSADEAAVKTLSAFWMALGSRIDVMDAEHHDLVLAITSHVPHLIAYNIVGTADDLGSVSGSEVVKYAGGGFHDFTRIAASDPVMWRDVFVNNKDAVLEVLGRFNEDLAALQRAIRWGEGEVLEKLFIRTRRIRREVIAAGQAEVPKPKPDENGGI